MRRRWCVAALTAAAVLAPVASAQADVFTPRPGWTVIAQPSIYEAGLWVEHLDGLVHVYAPPEPDGCTTYWMYTGDGITPLKFEGTRSQATFSVSNGTVLHFWRGHFLDFGNQCDHTAYQGGASYDVTVRWVTVRPVYVRLHYGDTLWALARRWHTTVSHLVRLNHLPSAGSTIYAGHLLRVR